ncbi:MAG: hypothetical protein IPF54_25715 [Draconibacterium sp.]|nr:hypothetical protein [Draconibacterium sp.]
MKAADFSKLSTVEQLKNYAENKDYYLNTLLFNMAVFNDYGFAGRRTTTEFTGNLECRSNSPWNSGYTLT